MEMRKENLIDLKHEAFNLSNNETIDRIILEGKKPILLATTVFTETNKTDKDLFESSLYSFYKKNSFQETSLDDFIYSLYNELGVYGVIEYIPMSIAEKDLSFYEKVSRYYYNDDFRALIEKFNIDAFYSLNNGKFIVNREVDNLDVHEHNSSFAFYGLTGAAKGLTKLLDDAHLKFSTSYGGPLGKDEFEKLGLYFTDDVIRYYGNLNIGEVRNKPLERKNMWPRTLDISLNDNLDLEEFYKVFYEYLEWVLNELAVKGTYEAMAPMRKLKNN